MKTPRTRVMLAQRFGKVDEFLKRDFIEF